MYKIEEPHRFGFVNQCYYIVVWRWDRKWEFPNVAKGNCRNLNFGRFTIFFGRR
jgi:hypothetical protein